jgi:hypothetical protein
MKRDEVESINSAAHMSNQKLRAAVLFVATVSLLESGRNLASLSGPAFVVTPLAFMSDAKASSAVAVLLRLPDWGRQRR